MANRRNEPGRPERSGAGPVRRHSRQAQPVPRRTGRAGRRTAAPGTGLADPARIGILPQQTIRHSDVVAGQLPAALTSRVVIGQAKGVLAGRLQISTDDAFGSCGQRLAPAAGCGPNWSARSPAVPPRAAAHTCRPGGQGGDQRAGVST